MFYITFTFTFTKNKISGLKPFGKLQVCFKALPGDQWGNFEITGTWEITKRVNWEADCWPKKKVKVGSCFFCLEKISESRKLMFCLEKKVKI